MTTWTCGHHDSTGGVCGDQIESVAAPEGRCESGHHPTHWSPLTLWRCEHRDQPTDGDVCGDLRLGNATNADGPPLAPCRNRHEGWWVNVDAFADRPAPTTWQNNPDLPGFGQAKTSTLVVVRKRLDGERRGVTKKFRLKYTHKDGTPDEMKLYFTANVYADGRVGEVFVKADRMGTLARGALDATAIMMSLLLQHGVPLAMITSKLRHTRYGADGFTGDPEFPSCSSPLDLLAQWLDKRFGSAP